MCGADDNNTKLKGTAMGGEPTFLSRAAGCVSSEKMYNGETRIGRFQLCDIHEDVYELIALCAHPEFGTCYRSWGVYRLNDVPECYYNDPMRIVGHGRGRRKR